MQNLYGSKDYNEVILTLQARGPAGIGPPPGAGGTGRLGVAPEGS